MILCDILLSEYTLGVIVDLSLKRLNMHDLINHQEKFMTTKAFKYKKQAIKDVQPSMNVAGVPAWLGDTFVSADKDKTICAGFFRLEKGNALVYDYDYEEMKVVVDGTFIISDETGQKVTATVGDVLYFPSGSRITFTTPEYAVGFFCGQRAPL